MSEKPFGSRCELLRKPRLWSGFDHYFRTNWEARELLTGLKDQGIDITLVREFALHSFCRAGKDEDEKSQKAHRGRELHRLLPKAIVGCESAIEAFEPYLTSAAKDPGTLAMKRDFSELIALNQELAERYRVMLSRVRTGSTFAPRRLGDRWNVAYLILLKAHISVRTGWDEDRVLCAITHLVRAVHKTMNMRPSPSLRSLLQKAISHFEQNPQNNNIMERISHSATNLQHLYQMFPPLDPPFQQGA